MSTNSRVCSEVEVNVCESSLELFRCIGCNKFSRLNQEKLKRCGNCQSVAFCGQECQKRDWELGHKARCKQIRRNKKKLEKEAAELREGEGWGGEAMNFFDEEHVGYFWGLIETRNYCRQRFALFEELMEEALWRCRINGDGMVNFLALETALEHLFDLLTLVKSDNQGVRFYVPSLLVGLERYQDAYDFIKYWLIADAENESSTFMSMKNENMLESLEELDLNEYSDAGMVLDMALLKFSIYHAVRQIGTIENVLNLETSVLVGEFAGAPTSWLTANDSGSNSDYLLQTKQLLSCVHENNPFVLPGLINPKRMLAMRPTSYSRGSEEEAALILQRSEFWWKQNKFAHHFVRYFVRTMNVKLTSSSSLVPIPRNAAKRKAHDDKMKQFRDKRYSQRNDPSNPMYAMTHFERVKSTPPVIDLLTRIGADHLLQGRFPGTMQICAALVRAQADTEENLTLLFGNLRCIHQTLQESRMMAAHAQLGSPADLAGFGPFF